MTPRPDEPPQPDAPFGPDDLAPAPPPTACGRPAHPQPAGHPRDLRGAASRGLGTGRGDPDPLPAVTGHRGRLALADPALHGNEGNIGRWVRVKTEVLVLGMRKSFTVRPNGRSADCIAPGLSNGCTMACAYCYVPRRMGYANPITVFTSPGDVIAHLGRHIARQGRKQEPNQCDPHAWVYDIGENGDCSADALISDNTFDLIAAFRHWPAAKASFATRPCSRTTRGAGPGCGCR